MTYFRSNIDFQLFVVFVVSSIVFGYDCCDSYVIQPKIWEYKSRYDIGYEVAFATDKNRDYDDDNDAYDTNEPILLLNGFGVGSFHQHRLIPHLLRRQDDDNSAAVDGGVSYNQHRTIYCVDYLGQGRSWPIDCRDGLGESEKDLQYSADT
jgi:pimeloyl-ACP methyl ester carboxylesterase